MAGLVERLMGLNQDGSVPSDQADRPRIPVHGFQSISAEWARGQITGAAANTAVAALSQGVGLNAAEQAEAQALVGTVQTGGTTADQAARANDLIEIDQVLLLASSRTPPYDIPAAVRTRLGLP